MSCYKALIFLTFISLSNVSAKESNWGGSLKTHLMAGNHSLLENSLGHSDFSLLTSARINSLNEINSNMSFEASYEFSTQLVPKAYKGTISNKPLKYRIKDLETYPMANVSDDLYFQQNLDRFVITHSAEDYDLLIGRQAINKGSGRIVNPTDVFLPFPIGSIDSEFRTGIDSIRLQAPFGSMGEFDFGFIIGEDAKRRNNAQFISFIQPIKSWDTNYTIIHYRENWLVGFDLQGSLFSQGVWFEAAFNKMKGYNARKQKYLRAVLGMDYRFSDVGIIYMEYQFNGAGTTSPNRYGQNTDSLAFSEGGVHFLAKNYLGPGLSYEITPLWIYSSTLYLNLDDQSAFFDQRLEWNFKENLYFDLSAFIRAGGSGSEFSTYSNRFVTSLRTYF